MIGVIADFADYEVAREFFELFKTPWEFYRADQRYDVVLCTADQQCNGDAELVLVYGGAVNKHSGDGHVLHCDGSPLHNRIFSYGGHRIPIYGDAVTFPGKQSWLVKDEESEESGAYLEQGSKSARVRVGYDLFAEIRRLLTTGQPPANAAIPALDLHIALLRDFIVGCGIRLVEIPPVPEGYRFIACLTHDVDHPFIRQHKWDHTSFGFFYRAVLGSLARSFSGRVSIRALLSNWLSALKLPFVYMGVAGDFWGDFDDQYLQLENGLPSTFFFIPFKNYSGKNCDARAAKLRAARYGAAELSEAINKLTAAGCEIGLHGIDAWCDMAQANVELQEVRRLTGVREIGVRMHWLYYDENSPKALEKSGATYDSTIGYNETVGYRAGTAQVYKPLAVDRLLELPLHIMDTALFYPAYLSLSAKEAQTIVNRIADNAVQFGGCVTINWHDRSLAPERLWGGPYRQLIQNLKNRGAWFATAGQAVAWFQKRRSATFESDCSRKDEVSPEITKKFEDNLPGLQLRIRGTSESAARGRSDSEACTVFAAQDRAETRVSYDLTR